MPEITLEVVSMDSNPVADRICKFSGVGGTIGRDEGNTLVLPDKHRRVSRLHASITFPQGVPMLANASTTLPVSVGGAFLSHGQKMPLAAGDLIEIGPYILRLQSAGGMVAEDSLIGHVQPTVQIQPVKLVEQVVPASAATHAGAHADPLAGLMSTSVPADGSDPFADLFTDLAPAAPMPVALTPIPVSAQPVQRPTPASTALTPRVAPPSPQASPPPRPVFVAPAHAVIAAPAASSGGGFSSRIPSDFDPFADLLGLGAPAAPPQAAPIPPNGAGNHHDPVYGGSSPTYRAPEQRPSALIPDDFNPFELPSQTARNAADPLSQMLGSGPGTGDASIAANDLSIDALFAPAAPSPLDSLMGGTAQPSTGSAQNLNSLAATVENSDPLLMFGSASPDLGASIHSPMRDDLPELGGAYQPPRAHFQEDRAFAMPQQGMPMGLGNPMGAAPSHANPDALTSAFLQAAGLPATALPGGLTPELMTVIGSLLHTATAGAIDMLAARAATKLEVQASVTIISSQSNNPLKFLPNAESALQQMLGKKMPGFMRADQAMRDAFDDLRAHEIGVIAGTRAALTEVLGRFDPAILEKRLTGGSLLDSLLPSMRKNRLWEIYLEQYTKIRREAEDDFQSIFGRSFLEAYEREAGRVKAHTTESGKNQ